MLLWIAAFALALLRLAPINAEAATEIGTGDGSAEQMAAPYYREYYYTGGHYVNSTDGFVFRGQMYVERLIPAVPTDQLLPPIIIIHGGGQTGTNFLNTPDNRPGWSSFFLLRNHTVYLLDRPYTGRSPWTPRDSSDSLSTFSAEDIQRRFTAPERYRLWPQAESHTQWPGTGVRGDPVFDAYYSSTVPNPYLEDLAVTERAFRVAIADLLQNHIKEKSFVIGHSQGGLMAWQTADAVPELVQGLVVLEPSGPPFREQVFSWGDARAYGVGNAPLEYEPPVTEGSDEEVRQQFHLVTRNSGDPAVANCTLQAEQIGKPPRKLSQISKVPVLLMTSEASYHAVYDFCTVDFLKQAGVSVEWINLQNRGVRGNGHMLFMEENNWESATVLYEWLETHLP